MPGGPPSPPLHCAGRDGGALSSQNVPRRPGGCSLGSRERERRCGGWASCGPGDGGRRPAQMVATQVDRDGRGERSVPNAFALAVTLFPGMLCLEPLSRAPQVCLKPLCLKPLCTPPCQPGVSTARSRYIGKPSSVLTLYMVRFGILVYIRSALVMRTCLHCAC